METYGLVSGIAGAMLFKPSPHVDERGFFCRTFDADVMRGAGIDPAAFVQDSLSRSARGVVRGLHVRRGDGEAKLVRCSYGAIFDVIVDLRPASPTYRNWESFELRDHEQTSLYVPAVRPRVPGPHRPWDVSYSIDRPHDPADDVSIAFDERRIGHPVASSSHRHVAGQGDGDPAPPPIVSDGPGRFRRMNNAHFSRKRVIIRNVASEKFANLPIQIRFSC